MRPICAAFLFAALLLAGCAVAPPNAVSPSAAIGSGSFGPLHVNHLRIPADVEEYLRLTARGVQVFRCERVETVYLWRFVQPDAQLFDSRGRAVATHGADFSFRHIDGSALATHIVAYEDIPNVKDLRPVLMAATSSGKGAFAAAVDVARIENNGGLPPASCKSGDVGRVLRVPFTADFVFFRKRTH